MASAVFVVCVVLIATCSPLRRSTPEIPPWALRTLGLTLFLFPVLVSIHQIGLAWLGEQGIDFAIFSQAIHSVAKVGQPIVSLVSVEPTSFLTHHFTPAIYLFGLPTLIGVPAYISGIAFHGISIAGALSAAYALAKEVSLSRSQAIIVSCLTWAAPTMSVGMLWGIHDETFALPLIGYGTLFWLRSAYWRSAICFISTILLKETFLLMLVIVPVALAAKQSQSFRKVTFPYFVAMCIGIFGAILFWGVRPYFFDVSFNAVSRISTLDQLLDPTTLQRKALYVWWTVVPSLFLGLFSSKGRSLLLLASPFLALSVISNFEEMYKPMNYYSVVPGYLCSLAAIVTIPQVIRTRTGIPVVFLLLSAAISFSQQPAFARPLRTIRRLSKDTVAIPETLNFISDDARVIVGDRDASFVYDKVPIRLWSANQTDHKWDSILIRQNSVAEVDSRLSRQTHVCFEDSNWQLLCKK